MLAPPTPAMLVLADQAYQGNTFLAQAADTLLLTVPNQFGVDYNAQIIVNLLRYVAPELGWR